MDLLTMLDEARSVVYVWRWENDQAIKIGRTTVGLNRWSSVSRPTDVPPSLFAALGEQVFLGFVPVSADRVEEAEKWAHRLHESARQGTSEWFSLSDRSARETLKAVAAVYNTTAVLAEEPDGEPVVRDVDVVRQIAGIKSNVARCLNSGDVEGAQAVWDKHADLLAEVQYPRPLAA